MDAVTSDCNFDILGGRQRISSGELMRFLHVAECDTVVLGGTLVEGIGNEMSDLDINVLAKERPRFGSVRASKHAFCHTREMDMCSSPEEEVFMTMDYYPNTDIHIDIEYWLFSEIVNIIERVDIGYRSTLKHCDVNYIEGDISRKEHLLLHRLMQGRVIYGESDIVPTKIHELRDKLAYYMYRKNMSHYWFFKDIVGALRASDIEMACEQAREYLIMIVCGANHAAGCTNPARKWWITYLKSNPYLPKQLIRDTITFLLGGMPPHRDSIFQAFSLVERIEVELRTLVDNTPAFNSTGRMLFLLSEEVSNRSSSACPVQDHEFEFRKRAFTSSGPGYPELLTW